MGVFPLQFGSGQCCLPASASRHPMRAQQSVIASMQQQPGGVDVFQRRFQPNYGVRFGQSSDTHFVTTNDPWTRADAEVLIIPVTQGEIGKWEEAEPDRVFKLPSGPLPGQLKMMDDALGGELKAAIKDDQFDGSKGFKILRVRPSDDLNYKKVVLLGLGQPDKLTADSLDRALATVFSHSSFKQYKSYAMGALPAHIMLGDRMIEGVSGGVARATYHTPDVLDSKKPADITKVVLLPDKTGASVFYAGDVGKAKAIADGISSAKDWANAPYDDNMTASKFWSEAQQVGMTHGGRTRAEGRLQAYAHDIGWVEDEMPLLALVGKASRGTDPAKFVELVYTPPGYEYKPRNDEETRDGLKKVAIVGKSVMMDTGGIQNKGTHQNGMHQDMTGGAYTLGIMKAIAQMQPKGVEVRAYLPMTPNMIGPDGFNPDTVRAGRNGKRVQIDHTDAEGRLTLIDAVAYAAEDEPDEIITIATLTGAASRAVGGIALMANNQNEADMARMDVIRSSAKAVGEYDAFDVMEVKAQDFKAIEAKRDNADIVNISQPRGMRGAQGAGAFVMSGLPKGSEIPLLHLDIAGEIKSPHENENITARGMRTLLHYLDNYARD